MSTDLLEAVYNLDSETVSALLEHGANPNFSNELGQTSLHVCLKNSKENVDERKCRLLRLLLQAGGDTNRRDKQGRVPIDYAKIMEERKCIAALEEHGKSNTASTSVATPTKRRYWQCPACGGILEKKTGTNALSAQAQLVGSAACDYCGSAHEMSSVYAGKYDFRSSDSKIGQALRDRDNMSYDEAAKRWRYNGTKLALSADKIWWQFWKS